MLVQEAVRLKQEMDWSVSLDWALVRQAENII